MQCCSNLRKSLLLRAEEWIEMGDHGDTRSRLLSTWGNERGLHMGLTMEMGTRFKTYFANSTSRLAEGLSVRSKGEESIAQLFVFILLPPLLFS